MYSPLETKFAHTAQPLSLTGEATIQGYASLFNQADQNGDIVVKGAYAASLARLKTEGCGVKMLWQHDPSRPIGIWDEVREDDKGLFVKGRLLDTVQAGREALALVQAGALDGLSIGYKTVRAQKGEQGRRLLEIDLWEVSLVTFPMLGTARIDAIDAPHPPKTPQIPADETLADMIETLREGAKALRSITGQR